MNPMTVKLFDINSHKVQQGFLDMCTTNSGTADEIFQKMNDVFKENDLTWNQCVGLSVDNTAVNLGIRNGLKAKILGENENVYVMGCPCHIIHNTAMKANKAFVEECDFDIEDFSIDNFYWLDKSRNRKNKLLEFCQFVDTEYRQILNHISVRWLSLEKVTDRLLLQYPALKSYHLFSSRISAKI